MPSYFVMICGYLSTVFNVVRTCFLLSISDVPLDPLSSPAELSSRFLLLYFYFIHDQRTPSFEQLLCMNYRILFI